MHNVPRWQTLEPLSIYRIGGLDQLCSWTPRGEGEDGGWHGGRYKSMGGGLRGGCSVRGSLRGSSDWVWGGVHVGAVHGFAREGNTTQHKNRKRGRGRMERADVMQPPAARTPVLCGRWTVCFMTDVQKYDSHKIKIDLFIYLYLLF